MKSGLRPFWNRFFGLNEKFGFFLILLICVPRFLLVLQANVSGNYSSIGIIMVASAVAPFLFLSKHGREQIGIIKPKRYNSLVIGLLLGLLFSFLLFCIGKGLFGNTYQNWYNYIGRSYHISPTLTGYNKARLFVIMASTGMIFSPIGEEFFSEELFMQVFLNLLAIKKHL